MRCVVAASLVLSVSFNLALLIWFAGVGPLNRQIFAARLDARTHSARPVVVLGDSIIAEVEAPKGVYNLAVPGATAAFTLTEVLPRIRSLEPRRVLIGLGINDLRYGAQPQEAARHILDLANAVAEDDSSIEVIVLAVLPLARSTTLADQADNSEISELNGHLAKAITTRFRYIDHSHLFLAGDALDDRLTHDGLHLNGLGKAVLSRLLFSGLAMDAR